MIVLGACWAWDPLQHVLQLEAQVLVKDGVELREVRAWSMNFIIKS